MVIDNTQTPSRIDGVLNHPWIHKVLYTHYMLKSKVFPGVTIDFCFPKRMAKRMRPGSGGVAIAIDQYVYSVNMAETHKFVQAINTAKNVAELAGVILKYQEDNPGKLFAYMIRADGSLRKIVK